MLVAGPEKMKIVDFDLERGQSLWENEVDWNLSESGVHPVDLRGLAEMGLDLAEIETTPLGYIQTNGSPELRRTLAEQYPGASADHIEITNGTSEANFLLAQTLLEPGDVVLSQTPNYLQVAGVARNLGATAESFGLCQEKDWEPDWEEFESGLEKRPSLIYLSHPNNPTGHLLSRESRARIVDGAERVGAWLLVDEVYRGAELDGEISPSFWGASDRVIVVGGLSKAYGLPGARIGWLVAPPEIVERCWALHDYTSIAPGTLGDRIARFAVQPENQTRLFARARSYMLPNRDLFREWVDGMEGLVDYNEPRAGAYAFVRYNAPIQSVALCDALRERRSVLLVAGAWMGMEGFLRIGLGTPRLILAEGLCLVKEELGAVASS